MEGKLLFFEFYFFIQQVLIINYLFYTYQCIHVNPNLLVHPTTPPPAFSPWCPYMCPLHLCLYFCLANWFIYNIFLDSTCMRYYTIFVFLFLTDFTLYDRLQVICRDTEGKLLRRLSPELLSFLTASWNCAELGQSYMQVNQAMSRWHNLKNASKDTPD